MQLRDSDWIVQSDPRAAIDLTSARGDDGAATASEARREAIKALVNCMLDGDELGRVLLLVLKVKGLLGSVFNGIVLVGVDVGWLDDDESWTSIPARDSGLIYLRIQTAELCSISLTSLTYMTVGEGCHS